jgi:hypothetical protein
MILRDNLKFYLSGWTLLRLPWPEEGRTLRYRQSERSVKPVIRHPFVRDYSCKGTGGMEARRSSSAGRVWRAQKVKMPVFRVSLAHEL